MQKNKILQSYLQQCKLLKIKIILKLNDNAQCITLYTLVREIHPYNFHLRHYVVPRQMENYVIREDDLNFSNDNNNESMTDTLDAGVQSQHLLLISLHERGIHS